MRQITKTISAVVLSAGFGAGGCAVLNASMNLHGEQEQEQEEANISQLETMTVAGKFSTIAGYVHQQIDQHPDTYRNELYAGAEVALRHAPNGVYEMAIRLYEEDVHEYFEQKRYTLEKMTEREGFSFAYDMDYDE